MWEPFIFGDEDCDVHICAGDKRSIDEDGTEAHNLEGYCCTLKGRVQW
jgi:hypothetical protein